MFLVTCTSCCGESTKMEVIKHLSFALPDRVVCFMSKTLHLLLELWHYK